MFVCVAPAHPKHLTALVHGCDRCGAKTAVRHHGGGCYRQRPRHKGQGVIRAERQATLKHCIGTRFAQQSGIGNEATCQVITTHQAAAGDAMGQGGIGHPVIPREIICRHRDQAWVDGERAVHIADVLIAQARADGAGEGIIIRAHIGARGPSAHASDAVRRAQQAGGGEGAGIGLGGGSVS